jgi:hypothetical protein
MAKYLVTEIQTWESGAVQNPTWAYDDENAAMAKYHSVLAAAAVSQLPVHACAIFTNEGFPMRNECYKHTPAPEPTPEPEGE